MTKQTCYSVIWFVRRQEMKYFMIRRNHSDLVRTWPQTKDAQWSFFFHWNPEFLCLSRKIGQINSVAFGVFLAEPFSALSFPYPRFPLFCCFFHKKTFLFDLTKKILSRCSILSEISRWTDHGKYELFPASTKGLYVIKSTIVFMPAYIFWLKIWFSFGSLLIDFNFKLNIFDQTSNKDSMMSLLKLRLWK